MQADELMRDARAVDAVARALAEDVGSGDITSLGAIGPDEQASAELRALQPCILSGLPVAAYIFHAVDSALKIEELARDGDSATVGQTILRVSGPARGILTAERTALNFIQRMSGIATATNRYVEIARPFGAAILDTRKTTPGLRVFEKYAVTCGGGLNHRFGLYDQVLLKDNHRALWQRQGKTLAKLVSAMRAKYPGVGIEIEVESLAEFEDAMSGGPDWILLDNMPSERLAECVRHNQRPCRLEASGGITLKNLAAVAATGIDAISVGALTHSVAAVDFTLEFAW